MFVSLGPNIIENLAQVSVPTCSKVVLALVQVSLCYWGVIIGFDVGVDEGVVE